MKDLNVLWIDDDFISSNDGIKEKLLNIAEEINLMCNLTCIESSEFGLAYIHENRVDLLILDLYYENKRFDSSFMGVLNHARERSIHYIIFSNKTLEFSDLINSLLNDPLYINKFEKNLGESLINAVRNFTCFTPINILHLSDLHFDSHLMNRGLEEAKDRETKLLTILEKEKQKGIDFIVISGDFTKNDPANDLKKAESFIKELFTRRIIIDCEKLMIVPGNHDFTWKDYVKGIVDHQPGLHFFKFLENIYDKNLNIISSLLGYNSHTHSFESSYHPSLFTWERNFQKSKLEFIGFSSTNIDKNFKGSGKLLDTNYNFLDEKWGGGKSNTFRIAILHHNILPSFSINRLDENDSLFNSGFFIEKLALNRCDLVLSGHCHDSYLYKFSYSSLFHEGFTKRNSLLYSSVGTTGGYSNSNDRARSFNIINITNSHLYDNKILILRPFIYDSREGLWKELQAISSSSLD